MLVPRCWQGLRGLPCGLKPPSVDVACLAERMARGRCPGKGLCQPWGAAEQEVTGQMHPANPGSVPRSPTCAVTWGPAAVRARAARGRWPKH